ncbi:MAG: glycosyltransferase [Alistipes senegalensis]|nr:glycosyltransferase [Bacteroides cellulosilyticus]MCM1352545.1 glycosyltransferase [Alistipes senegalensis]
MNIVVLATATRESGALMIYKQFLSYLPQYVFVHRWFIFVDASMPQPKMDGVEYIYDNNHSWKHRIWFDWIGLKRWIKKRKLTIDCIVSLQNIGACIPVRQIIYYHQAIPFFPNKWNFIKRSERRMWLYKYLYPYFVKLSLYPNTDVVTQIPFIKQRFVQKFGADETKVHVMFPDVEKIETACISEYDFQDKYIHFIYPATAFTYKEHRTIIEALALLREKDARLFSIIRVHFSIVEGENVKLDQLVKRRKVERQIVYEGRIEHNKLLSIYKSVHGLLFPSTVETMGLPLLEAAIFGCPIVANNLEYAHEVLERYEGVCFVPASDYIGWSEAIRSLCINRVNYRPVGTKASSWPLFFQLILNQS